MDGSRVRKHFVVAAAVSCIAFAACSSGSSSSTPSEPSGGETGGDASTLNGEQLAREKCVQCHSYDRVERAEKDAAGWESTINKMIRQGLNVTEEERQAILDYLSGR